MISPRRRERAEISRSAHEADSAQKKSHLLTSKNTITRYHAPAATTIFPLEYAFHLLGDVRGKTILEYGCGNGENTVVLANRGAKIIALDISAELLAIARKRLEANGCHDVDLLIGSAHDLPLADESVDIIFGMAILHHLDLHLASHEVLRVLKKGGRGIFEEPTRNSKLVRTVRRLFPQRADVSEFERPLTNQEMREFAAACRYEAKTFQLLFSSLASLVPRWSKHAIRLSAQLDAHLLRLVPPLAYYGTITVFQMTKE
ncbi:MAG TPA: class I SAM-dependent methyltransferase [Pyrinomonadaceae bacterium]|nr:class I SAM-dependent methyltransferase [Pyrinomonadaceae bacterium]